MTIEFTINGTEYEEEPEPGILLRDFLREDLYLTGTKKGCETGKCGMCTVLVDGEPVKSCLMLAHQADGAEITTIEGVENLSSDGLHEVQEAFIDNHATQCGYCTPGMVMTAMDAVDEDLSREEIRDHIEGNICRCTGYRKIVDAIEEVSRTSE